MFNGKIHYKWPFSIAMLVYQGVDSPASFKSQLVDAKIEDLVFWSANIPMYRKK
jgi:hypothetical protein